MTGFYKKHDIGLKWILQLSLLQKSSFPQYLKINNNED